MPHEAIWAQSSCPRQPPHNTPAEGPVLAWLMGQESLAGLLAGKLGYAYSRNVKALCKGEVLGHWV